MATMCAPGGIRERARAGRCLAREKSLIITEAEMGRALEILEESIEAAEREESIEAAARG